LPPVFPKYTRKAMSLTSAQQRHLRKLAHNLKPLVIIGNNGLTENVVSEIDQTLAHHELIKVRVNAEDREERDAMIAAMCEGLECALVQRIGHIAVIYRAAEEPVIRLP
jgi:RNA-binding protein